jgi:hypothetical protein
MRRQSDPWRQKVHAVFIELAEAYKESIRAWQALGPNPPAELVNKIDLHFQERTEKIRKRYAGNVVSTAPGEVFSAGLDLIFVPGPSTSPPSQRDNQGFLENLYWERYREPLWIALQKANAGDLEALRRVARVGEYYERLRFGKGPIKRSKFHLDHPRLLEIGIDLGLNRLGAEELATCFDAICPCGEIHDPDALKKQRSRVVKALERAAIWLQQERAKIPSREWLAAYGKDQLFAKAIQSPDGKLRGVMVGEIGKAPECHINKHGELSCVKGSRFRRRPFLRRLLAAFNVKTTKELFKMFFPSN